MREKKRKGFGISMNKIAKNLKIAFRKA